MINHELAKELKDRGHPGMFMTDHESCNYHQVEFIDGIFYHIPNLEELIEACGPFIIYLRGRAGSWDCEIHEDYRIESHGTTPAEAVAKLWLKLKRNG